jgi:hypothetical protein
MNLKHDLLLVQRNIERQKDAICDLHKIIEERKNTQLAPDKDISMIEKDLVESEKKLKNLQRRYDQERLSDITKNGIQNEETSQWWMNRY